MKKNNKISEMPTEKLVKTEKLLKVIIYLLIIFSIVLFALGIYLMLHSEKSFIAIFTIPMGIGCMIILNAANLKAIQKELKARNL